MASQMKPLRLYGGILGPNPGKVAVLLTELRVPFETVTIPISDVKNPEYTAVNPNGRLPTLIDPNNGRIKIWESGAIIEYIIEKYDMDHELSYPQGTEKYYHCKQFLHYQMSGQGPYFGQAWVFTHYWPEKLPAVIGRYMKEIKRVHGVLEGILAGRDWLVGDKCTYADLAFMTWEEIAMTLAEQNPGFYDIEKDFPNVHAWQKRITEKPLLKQLSQERIVLMDKVMAAGRE
ncbi:related to theta class glutathione S-transferase [Rhynchosporium graminicola]|uniref:Related to theta class glutathione S-transferase n=1 Tax=Rhynchosporium graminicola TaxID=2792576 RepID=A0A1E1K5L5_9HELO|nr:related to theta class glutathione S-transferase [Rhynchosporium commune]